MANVHGQVNYGKVIYNVREFLADTPADADSIPDARPLTGTVSASPSVTVMKWPTATPPQTSIITPITIPVINGLLYPPGTTQEDVDGPTPPDPGIWLVAEDQPDAAPNKVHWTFTFRLSGVSVQPPSLTGVAVPTGGEVDLTLIMPTDPDPGVSYVVVSESGVVQSIADATAAANAANAALSSKANVADLGTAAASDVTDFATAAQGTKADTAVQPAALSAYQTTATLDAAVAAAMDDPDSDLRASADARFGSKRDAGALPVGTATPDRADHPRLENPVDAPILSAASVVASGLNGLYWPNLIDMSEVGIEGVRLIFSSDHAGHSQSGFGLASADSPLGPFTFIGRVWRDDTDAAEQCETPSRIGRDADGWLFSYQMMNVPGTNATQVGMIARCTSDDLESGWSRVGVMYDPRNRDLPRFSGVHTGYATPWQSGGQYFADTLLTGNTEGTFYSTSALLASTDGINWTPDPRPKFRWPSLIEHIDGFDILDKWALALYRSAPFQWRGAWWVIGTAGASTSGTTTTGFRLVAVRLSNDFRRATSRPIDVTPPAQSWMGSDPIDQVGAAFAWQGRVFLPFRSGGSDGAFGIMEVV